MEYENTKIGKEMPQVTAKRVLVLGFIEVDVKDKDNKEIGKKLVLRVQHPDIPEMEISKAEYKKGKLLKQSGLWLGKDKDGNIPYNSAVANLLRQYSCNAIRELVGKQIDTTTDDNGYIIAKAY